VNKKRWIFTDQKSALNPHLHFCVLKHRGQNHFRPVEYPNRPPKVLLIFNFKNFGEFQKFLIKPEMRYLNAIFCFLQLKQHWNKILLYKHTNKGNFWRGKFWHYKFSHLAPPGGVIGGQNFKLTFWARALRAQEIP
jgi:hypothetical protein